MCGIAGVFAYRGEGRSAKEAQLLAAREAMQVRGPDGAGLWWDEAGRIGFAHRRLAVIDLEDRALQPMHMPERALTIVFNGEIYNYRELRSQLIESGFQPKTESDTEVILELFAREGADMVRKLRGMFALAIWDTRRGRLFLARDPYGIKPLYYAEAEGALHFASQVKALAAFSSVSTEADPAGMVGFQLFGTIPEPFTLFRAISALPAGAYLWAGEAGVADPVRYAKVAEELAGAAPDDGRPLEALVAEAALDSVRAHLVADVEVGAFLSSGIDSGALIGLMRDAGQSRIRAITLGFEELRGTPDDEVPLAAEIARRYDAEHHVRWVTAAEFSASADSILAAMDQPSIDGINTWFVSKAAHECGLKVVVSGLGGDELLAGYSTFRTVPRTRRLGMLGRVPFASRFGKAMLRRFAPDVVRRNPKMIGVLDMADSWAGAWLVRRAMMLPFELDRKLDAETIRDGMARLQPLALIGDAMTPAPRSAIGKVAALESSLYMRNQLLRDSDWASMAHSLELRVPYVDWPTLRRIAPVAARLEGGAGKRALARSPSLPLPERSIARGRTGFNIPVANWIGATASPVDRLGSRHWSENVLNAFRPVSPAARPR
jgi:asparagine synthase (glutamine-hydrolysing)